MDTFTVRILEADSPFYVGPCEMINVPSTDGLIGILANHSNMIAAIAPGEMTNGLIKIEDGEVLILAESIERPEEIDANRARRKAEEAKEAMLQQRSIREFKMAELEMLRMVNRVKIKKKYLENL